MRWLAISAAVVVVGLAVLLVKVLGDDDHPASTDVPVAVASATDSRPTARPVIADARPAVAHLEDDPEGPQPAWPEIADARTDEFLAQGMEFYERVDDYGRQRFPSMAASCYQGGEDPKAKLKLHYRLSIRNHVVTVRDVKVVESSFKSQSLVDCMVRTFEGASFDDTNMPEFESPENDPQTIRIRIEALKRFKPAKDEGD